MPPPFFRKDSMRRTHAGFIGILLAGSLALAGCGSPAAQPVPSASASSEPAPTVLRAGAAERERAAAAMQAVTDHYGVTAWAAAKVQAAKLTVDEREQDPAYAQLLVMAGTGALDESMATIAPLLSGKALEDFEAWQSWQGDIIHLGTSLQAWAGGDVSMEAEAGAALAEARNEIEKVRK